MCFGEVYCELFLEERSDSSTLLLVRAGLGNSTVSSLIHNTHPASQCNITYLCIVNHILIVCLKKSVDTYLLDLLKTVLGKNSFDKQRHEKIKISDRGIVSKFHDVR